MTDRNQLKIVTIIGARPQFIKAATISRAIAAHNRNGSSPAVVEILIHTGQHYDDGMSAIFFRELEIPEPKYNLNVRSGPHGQQTGQMLAAIEETLLMEQPDWVLIYGDTNSTLAGALAAAKLHIPVAHVEAGLRSFNRHMPEEINRVVTDHLSTFLFCPSQTAVDNLIVEGIVKGVSIVGDVMADALQFAVAKVSENSDILNRLGLQPQRYLLATVHRAENTDDPKRLINIMEALSELAEQMPVILPLHPRTKKILKGSFPSFLNLEDSLSIAHSPSSMTFGLKIIDPVGYFDIIAIEKSARMLLTDSGGMQKEAYWLKVPCITLRDETEWVETVKSGWNILTGADQGRIVAAVRSFKPPSDHPTLYCNDYAAEEIVKTLLKGNPFNHD